MSYERAHIASMSGYTPGEQPSDPRVIKLNTNENPYPPSPAVAEALKQFDAKMLRKYPEPSSRDLRQSIAARLGIDDHEVLVTNGGDELLRLVFTTFCEPGSWVLSTEPTYSLYPVLAELQACRWKSLPLEQGFSLPNNLADEAGRLQASLVLIVNPHAPTGRLFKLEELAKLAAQIPGVLLIDEAYVDFVDPDIGYKSVNLIKQHPNVLLLRTFSKGYSLAGLRLGFGLGQASLIEPMASKVRDSYNLDALAQSLGLAAWEDELYAKDIANKVRRERALLTTGLRNLDFEVSDSQTNFVYAEPPEDMSSSALYDSLKAQGILVRYFHDGNNRLRISIGTQDENQRLLETCARVLAGDSD